MSGPLFRVQVGALHTPIRQEAVLLADAEDNPAARGFFDYLTDDEAIRIIGAAGYGVPE